MKSVFSLLFIFGSLTTWGNYPLINYWNLKGNPVFGIGEKSQIFTSYSNKYFLKEWNNKLVGGCWNKNGNSIQGVFLQKGNSKFSNNNTSLAYVKTLSPNFKLGIGVDVFFIQQMEFKSTPPIIKPYAGLSFQLDLKNEIFCSLSNPDLTPTKNEIPDQLNISWLHKREQLNFLFSGLGNQNGDLNFKVAGIYNLHKKVNFSLEINSTDEPIFTSTQINLSNFAILIQYSYHQKLGLSNQIGLSYKW